MPFDDRANFAISTVRSGSGVIGSAVGVTVKVADASRFPSVPFNASLHAPLDTLLDLADGAEIVRVTAFDGVDTFTVTRGQQDTAALSDIAAGWYFYNAPTAGDWEDIEDAITGISLTPGPNTFQATVLSGERVFANRPVGLAAGEDYTVYSPSAPDQNNAGVALSDGSAGDTVAVQFAGVASSYVLNERTIAAGRLVELDDEQANVGGERMDRTGFRQSIQVERAMGLALSGGVGATPATAAFVFQTGVDHITTTNVNTGGFTLNIIDPTSDTTPQVGVDVGNNLATIQTAVDNAGVPATVSGTDWSDFTLTYTDGAWQVDSIDNNTDGDVNNEQTTSPSYIVMAALLDGTAGNAVTIEIVDPGVPDDPGGYAEAGTAATITLATDGGGSIISTPGDVENLINTGTLIRVTGSGGELAAAEPETPFTGGDDGSPQFDLIIALPVRFVD